MTEKKKGITTYKEAWYEIADKTEKEIQRWEGALRGGETLSPKSQGAGAATSPQNGD